MASKILAAFLLAVLLSGCGGGGSDSPAIEFTDTAPTMQVSRVYAAPISRDYPQAGTYTLTVIGTYAVTSFVGADKLSVFFSFSGRGQMVGEGYPTYAITANRQSITVSQSVTVTMTGAGPWQMEVLTYTGTSEGTLSNLTMTSVQN